MSRPDKKIKPLILDALCTRDMAEVDPKDPEKNQQTQQQELDEESLGKNNVDSDEYMLKLLNLFFSKDQITHTLQCMLLGFGSTLDDVCNLAIMLHHHKLVFALCNDGLMPFAHNFQCVIPFEYMSKAQLQFVRKCCRGLHNSDMTLHAVYVDGFLYSSKIEDTSWCVDDKVLLFGISNLINQSLGLQRDVKEQYINNCLYTIVNACHMRQPAVRAASRLFEEEGGISW